MKFRLCRTSLVQPVKERMMYVKKAVFFIIAATLCFSLAACSKDGDASTESQETQEDSSVSEDSADAGNNDEETATELMEINTEYGTLFYPVEWEDSLNTEETNSDGFLTVLFSTEADGQSYDLFRVMINSEEGDSVGTVTSEDGTERNVFVETLELSDISGLSEDEQNRLYAMQEGINVLMENLD